ncbi:Phage exonuclease [Lysobacter dokdonensis DS-58]|uniref:Phage exonuclease n=1 Tax=Lysobacter dokdonensis DS-58 TaxID=1300345 RepID=A0A0A2WNN0_9GAMM|nr:ribonuclease H-like domain-containing protein [Lysobacter dokdonensis]KGQ19900.1 Phage exonuclease [Lysobacter dokdonensis DS-58]
MSRILCIDIETRPMESRHWGLWGQNIAISQIQKPDGLLCFAAQFVGERKVHYASQWDDGERGMVRAAHKLLDEADVVMGWNSQKFDVPWLQRCFIEHKLHRPSPFKQLDLMRAVKKYARLPSYKLQFVAGWLNVGSKLRTGGMELWDDVLAGDDKAREKMRRYNIQDTKLTGEVYAELSSRGWVSAPVNHSTLDGHVCPHCASDRLQARGYDFRATRRYKRWFCLDCKRWSSSVASEPGSAQLRPAA